VATRMEREFVGSILFAFPEEKRSLYKKSLCLIKTHTSIIFIKITAHGTSGISSCLLDVAENKLYVQNVTSVTGPIPERDGEFGI